MKANESYGDLVYQVGIANVFLNGTRVFQGDFRGAELIAQGLVLAGVSVKVHNCDIAGDCTASTARWTAGPGELWRDKKLPPQGAINASA